jgi:small subunit ribosomal protein S16
MVKIRLKRIGAKKRASYRIVVIDSRTKRDGKTVVEIGHYHPVTKEPLSIDIEKAEEWIKKGAQVTQKVKKLLALSKKGGVGDEGVDRVSDKVIG